MEEIKTVLMAIYKKLCEMDAKLKEIEEEGLEMQMELMTIRKDVTNIQYDFSILTDKGV